MSSECGEVFLSPTIPLGPCVGCLQQLASVEAENKIWRQRFRELKYASLGTILNEEGDPLYALIPLRLLNDQ